MTSELWETVKMAFDEISESGAREQRRRLDRLPETTRHEVERLLRGHKESLLADGGHRDPLPDSRLIAAMIREPRAFEPDAFEAEAGELVSSSDLQFAVKRPQQGETPNRRLDPLELVNEAYCRFFSETGSGFQDRDHFYRVAARAMRRVLVDISKRLVAAEQECAISLLPSIDSRD